MPRPVARLALLLAPQIARRGVSRAAWAIARDWMIGQRNQARTQKPVNGCGRVIHRQPNDIVIGLTARDFNNVVEMFVGRIDDALGLLQRRATSADLPIGQMQRSTNHRGCID